MSRTSLALAFADDDLDDAEFYYFMRTLPKQEALMKTNFQLSLMTFDHVLKNFRFSQEQLFRLKEALHFPEVFIVENCCAMKGLDALCLLLRQLAYASRLHDLEILFVRASPELSRFFNAALFHVHEHFLYLITELDQP